MPAATDLTLSSSASDNGEVSLLSQMDNSLMEAQTPNAWDAARDYYHNPNNNTPPSRRRDRNNRAATTDTPTPALLAEGPAPRPLPNQRAGRSTYNWPIHAHNGGPGWSALAIPAAAAVSAMIPGSAAFAAPLAATILSNAQAHNTERLNRRENVAEHAEAMNESRVAHDEAIAREDAVHDRERREFMEDTANNNLYNSPAAQKARYQAAGLNPNLMYSGSFQQAPATAVFGGHGSKTGSRYTPRKRSYDRRVADTPSFDPSVALKMQEILNQLEYFGTKLEGSRLDNAGKVLDNKSKAQKIVNDRRAADDAHKWGNTNSSRTESQGGLTEEQKIAMRGGYLARMFGTNLYSRGEKYVRGLYGKFKTAYNKKFPKAQLR
ncbi:hypothetical protein FACS189467_7070 [Bacteroidia bacterium]|nr:hypothetical protein FACS189467_7070 [Bacteroidia bacterium]